MSSPQELIARVDAVAERLERLAPHPPPAGLTDPDQPGGERWEWGQVWAHVAEFPEYWLDQIDEAFASPDEGPVSFGRTKADPHRVEAIERDRRTPPADLMARIEPQLARLRAAVVGFTPEQWSTRRFAHPTLGQMDLSRIMEDFLVGHLEAHADQLESLVRGGE
ncbi:MAG: hypothetical protein M3Q23_03070 [Actinomycetota bacterium]|nr:hypothetical protein [Actinomycetota bacterium]